MNRFASVPARSLPGTGWTIVRTPDEARWLEFVTGHPQGNIFHTPAMAAVFARTRAFEPLVFAAVDNATGSIAGLISATAIQTAERLPRRLSGRTVLWGGILCDPAAPREVWETLLRSYDAVARAKGLFSEVRNLSDARAAHDFVSGQGYRFEDHLNYLVDIRKSPDQLFGSFSENRRRNIRKAIASGVTVEEIADERSIPVFYDILRETYSRIRVPLPEMALFQALFRGLANRGMAQLLLAKYHDEATCAVTLLLFKDTIYYWYAGTRNAFFSLRPNELVVWHAMQGGAANGYRTFDFGGAGRPDEKYGVRDFKARFGGTLVNYGRYTRVYHPFALTVSKLGYGVYRRFL